MPRLGQTDLHVHPLQLGGNPFGWTADEESSFAVLDRYAAAGGDFVDSADVYAAWIDGLSGGESETVIGRWLQSRRPAGFQVATKVGNLPGYRTLDLATIRQALENSLRRLGTDHIDLYYAHRDDLDTPIEETVAAFDTLVREGKIRYVGASNFSAPRLRAAIEFARINDLHGYRVVQDDYSLPNRAGYEFGTRPVAEEYGLVNLPYRTLAKGFVSGKYRPGVAAEQTTHSAIAQSYLDRYGHGLLTALDLIAERHGVRPAAVGLAWVAAQPTVGVPIAGARTVDQLEEFLPGAELVLDSSEIALLSELTTPDAPVAEAA